MKTVEAIEKILGIKESHSMGEPEGCKYYQGSFSRDDLKELKSLAQSDAEELEKYKQLLDAAAAGQETLHKHYNAELTALKESTRWIPVGERLPTGPWPALAVTIDGYVKTATCYADRGSWGADGRKVIVTHWMPLPQPPAEPRCMTCGNHDTEHGECNLEDKRCLNGVKYVDWVPRPPESKGE